MNEYKRYQNLKTTENRRGAQSVSPFQTKHFRLTNSDECLSAVTRIKRKPAYSVSHEPERSKTLIDIASEQILKQKQNNFVSEKSQTLRLNLSQKPPISSSHKILRHSKANAYSSITESSDLLMKLENTLQHRRNSFDPITTLRTILPNWLIARNDFYSAYMKIKQHVGFNLVEICLESPSKRTDNEKEALIKWVSNTRFFSSMPKVIIQETCDKFAVLEFQPGAQSNLYLVIRKDDVADCMYLIYVGTVGIYVNGTRVGQRAQGDSLGETALDNVKLRSADAIAETQAILFKLKKVDYENIILNLKKLEKYEYTKFLMTIPFFQRWSFIKVQNLSNLLVQSQYKPGDSNLYLVIYEKEDTCSTFYIIKEGKIQLQTYTHLEMQNKWPIGSKQWKLRKITNKFIYPLKTFHTGEFFGETEIIKNCPRETRAVAIEQSTCLVLNKDEFLNLFPAREQEFLSQKYVLRMPSKEKMELDIKHEMFSNEEKEEILLKAMKLGHGFEGGRDYLLDPRAKRLRGWYSSLRERTRRQRAKIQSKIVDQTEENLDTSK